MIADDIDDPRWQRIWRNLEVGVGRQALIRIASNLPEGQGRAINKQSDDVKAQQVLFVSQLITARKRQRMTQAQLAKRVGTTQTTIARIERGQTSPTIGMIFRIVVALGLRWNLR